jgi:hypothetical protein
MPTIGSASGNVPTWVSSLSTGIKHSLPQPGANFTTDLKAGVLAAT